MAAMSVITIAAAVYLLLSATALFVANALVVPDPSNVVEQVKENVGGLLQHDGNGGGFLNDAQLFEFGCFSILLSRLNCLCNSTARFLEKQKYQVKRELM